MEAGTAGLSLNPAFLARRSQSRPQAGPPEAVEELRQAEQLCQERRFREALGVLNRVVLAEPRNPMGWTLVARAHCGRGEHAEALTAARTAAQHTCDSEPLRMATAALVALERHAEAAEQAAQAVRREPQDWRNHVEQARALVNLPDRIAEARAAARAAVNIAPHKVTPHLVAGQVELAAGEVELAARAFRQVFTIDPANPAAYNELARLHLHGASESRSARWPLPRARRRTR
ncbi:MAG TPA: tetratricopeptide repeat protein [Solirubrobacteraceae bacterium]|nr:tetratricopeptide repeat protein [Solirubrobacteraceae bacterium]